MKGFAISFLFIVTYICGCTFASTPKVVTETYDTPLDSLYLQCADLKGVGMFEIGMPWNSVMKSKTLGIESWYREPHWYNGHWGVSDFDMEKWIISKHPEIKQYSVNVTSSVISKKYMLGDIEFNKLDLAFLNDKLVAAYFEFGYDTKKSDIKNHYLQKYGKGIGSYYSSTWDNGLRGDNYACDDTVRESREWKNEKVTLRFVYDYRFQAFPKSDNRRGLYWNDEYYIVFNEDGLTKFEEILKKAKEEYKSKKDDEHSNSLNSL